MKLEILYAVSMKLLRLESVYKGVMHRVKSKYGIAVWLNGSIRLTSIGLRLQDVVIEYGSLKVDFNVQCITITSDFKRLFSNKHKIAHLTLNGVLVNIKVRTGEDNVLNILRVDLFIIHQPSSN